MNSFFAKCFLDLQEHIKKEVPEIRWTDQNFGQYGDPEFPAKVAFPAALIDFSNTAYSAIGGNDQLGNATINIVLLFNPFSQSYNLAPTQVKQKALEYYEVEHKLCKALQGWSMDYFTPLARINAISQNRNEIGLRIRDLNFSTEFEDYNNEDETTQAVSFAFKGNLNS